MISQAAIRKNGKVWTLPRPARHHAVMAVAGMESELGITHYELADGEQGFITDEGEFLDRMSAAAHAVQCGQVKQWPSETLRERGYLNHPPNLYTEDLW